MDNSFFDRPILNSPYAEPKRHWKLDETGQPEHIINDYRHPASFITLIPAQSKQKKKNQHQSGKRFTYGFLIVTPGITIRDCLRATCPILSYWLTMGTGKMTCCAWLWKSKVTVGKLPKPRRRLRKSSGFRV